MDQFDALDCALRSRYLELGALPAAPVWGHLPAQLRAVLADALASGVPSGALLRSGAVLQWIWQIRAQLLGKPESSETRSQATAALRLGLLALRYQEGRLQTSELLRLAFHVADSYVCGIDPRPFLRLRSELEAGGADGGRVAALFAPYAASAEQCVRQWGLRPDCTDPNHHTQAEPIAADVTIDVKHRLGDDGTVS